MTDQPVQVRALELTDFRCYEHVSATLPDGVSVVIGSNGEGKTTLLEAVAWAALGQSFRGVPDAALVRTGEPRAVLRVELDADGRTQQLEAEIHAAGRNRVLVNRRPLGRIRDLAGFLRVTIFSPDDLTLVKGGPAERRRYLDELLVGLTPRYEGTRSDYERVLRHRNALLRGGLRDADARTTLDVFDDQLTRAGSDLVRGRLRLVDRLAPAVDAAYRSLAGADARVSARYEAEWAGLEPLTVDDVELRFREALAARRRAEIDRGATLVGPHRDDWRLQIDGLETRTQSSQGEQRSLALALRLAGHAVCEAVVGSAPVLLLDDVFSELDATRAHALIDHLPKAQTLLTSASNAIPEGIEPERVWRIADGALVPMEATRP